MPVFVWIIVAVVALILIYLAISYVFSRLLVYSHRQPLVREPREYGLTCEPVQFQSSDGLMLKGSFIPGSRKGIVVITHPFPFNRYGFSSKHQGIITRLKPDVDLLHTARAINRAGYSVLMFDFRNHGESESGITAVGLNEYHDVAGALSYLNSRPDLKDQPLGFASFCMGANATIIALSKMKESCSNVKCLVAVQPVSMSVFLRCYVKNLYTSLGLILIPMVERFCKWQGGYAFSEMTPRPYCRDLRIPVLYIQARSDPWTELDDIRGFYDDTPEPRELWLLQEEMSRFDAYNYVGHHSERIIDFIERYL